MVHFGWSAVAAAVAAAAAVVESIKLIAAPSGWGTD